MYVEVIMKQVLKLEKYMVEYVRLNIIRKLLR